jgi:RNA polymerase sigma factor (TIGR02999 family)
MRWSLADFARSRRYQKRGGNAVRVGIEAAEVPAPSRRADVVALDEALNALAEFDARQAQIVELRFFGGMSEDEIAEVLKTSLRTFQREWAMAKAWLLREMNEARLLLAHSLRTFGTRTSALPRGVG